MNEALRRELLEMQEEDLRVRGQLEAEGWLHPGYDPRMEEVHRQNAGRLRAIVAARGWPTCSLVGEDGAEAAWLVLQHSIGEPDLQRGYLPLLEDAARRNEIPGWQPAYLLDRIRYFEGKAQVYGTQYASVNDVSSKLWVIENPERVNDRRQSVGLKPIQGLADSERMSPEEAAVVRRNFEDWARRVGWLSVGFPAELAGIQSNSMHAA